VSGAASGSGRLLLSLAILTAALAVPVLPSAASSAGAARSPASFAGTVFGPRGQRLRGICITATSDYQGLYEDASESTGRGGTYLFRPASHGLPGTKFKIQFSPGCGNHGNFAPQWWKYTASEAKATTISDPPGTHLTGIDARLPAGGRITGTVRSAHGKPLAGICVNYRGPNHHSYLTARWTKANGSYLIQALATGRYLLRFFAGCGNDGNYLKEFRTVHVTVSRTTVANAVMQPGGTITGTVTSAAAGHKPLYGICVDAASPHSRGPYQTATKAGGNYRFRQLPPGQYEVSFSGGCGNAGSYAPQYYLARLSKQGATEIGIRLGQRQGDIDASMTPGAIISGKLISSTGRGLSLCGFLLPPQDLGGLGPATSELANGTNYDEFTTTNAGTYRLKNLAPGPYYLLFTGCGTTNFGPVWYPAAPHLTGASLVYANAGAITSGIDAVIRKGGTITGTIRGKNGGPLSVCTDTVDPTAPAPLSEQLGYPSLPGPKGRYSISGLSAGSYRVTVGCLPGNYANQWYRNQDSEAAANPVRTTAGHVTRGIDFMLRVGGSISGEVTARAGKPLPGVCASIETPSGNEVAQTLTNGAGHYHLAQIPTGTYKVQFAHCDTVSPLFAPTTRTAVRITVTHPVRNLDAVLRPGASISGTVLTRSSAGPPAPAPGVCVEATPKSAAGILTAAITGANGRYHLSGLAPGTYSLLFTEYCNGGTPQALEPLQYARLVAAGPRIRPAQINVTLSADGQITGTVDGPRSAPLAGICVTAQPTNKGTPTVTVTTSTGAYDIGSLAPGRYKVKFSSGCGATGYRAQWFSAATAAAKARPVAVKSGVPTNGINATLVG
jgi:hypothetical protein